MDPFGGWGNLGRVVLIVGSALACSNVGAQARFSFRESTLGDSQEKVKGVIAREFDSSRLTKPMHPNEVPVLIAGDENSISDDVCPYAASDDRRRQCTLARYVFAHSLVGGGLDAIFVDQAFAPSVSEATFVHKLEAAYGKARFTSRTARASTPFDRETGQTLTMVWGGAKTLPTSFRMNGFPYKDVEAIGGEFVAVEVEGANGMVRGYRLRIVDSERMQQSNARLMDEIKANSQARSSAAEASVKF
ncbi:hypothetical protein [Paraburkholderia tropica]|uniref:hypothetical protein n=1 Tax=Paraburkholderia tropica TaxID=92647 RepID=UPI003D2BE5BB